MNKYPQLLHVLSYANGLKFSEFFGGPKAFLIIRMATYMPQACTLLTEEK